MLRERDIVLRCLTVGMDPFYLTAGDCMSMAPATLTPETSVEDCARLMEEYQVRHLPVVDDQGNCCGIVTQADLARANGRRDEG
jgi:CBS domain-containing protein